MLCYLTGGSMESSSSFGYWLRRRRKALDLTQDDLARLAGCALDTVKKIETDARRPSRQLAERLAGCLQLAAEERADFLLAARAERSADRLPLSTQPVGPPAERYERLAMPVPASALLERELYLKALMDLLHEAAAGLGNMAFLGGEAGVGKTTLMRACCAAAQNSARVLLGSCDPLSTPRPLGPLVDIAAAGDGELQRLLDVAEQRDRAFRLFLAELQAGQRPTLVVFEDVHWSDEATLDLLRFLGRRITTTRALLVATYREDEVGPKHPLRVVLGDLATAPSVRRFTLPPLSVEAVRTLAAGSGLEPLTLHRQTGGNPFFVTEVLASGAGGIPATVRDAVLARAARLSPASRATLEAAAVIGPRIETWLLARVASTAAETVEECCSVGVLRPQGNDLAFRHELAREAILEAISPQRSTALHAATLAALKAAEPGPDELARLAHHAEAAGDRQAVLEYAPAAGHRAAVLQAHREAAAQYARALRFSHTLPSEQRATLLEARTYECYLTDQIVEAIQARQQALAIWRTLGNRLKEGESLRWLSRLQWWAGHNSEAEEAARDALEILQALPPGTQLAMAYSNLAQLRMLANDTAEAIIWGDRAIALAEQLGDRETLSHAYNNVGTARLLAGDEQGRIPLELSLRMALEAGLEEHTFRAYTNLASCAVRQYQFAVADPYLEDGIAYGTEHDLDSWRLYMLSWQAVSHLHQGCWTAAAAAANAVIRYPYVSPISRIQALVVLGLLQTRRGEPDASTLLDEALALAQPTGELQRVGPVRAARAEAAWLAGRHESACEEAQAGYDLALPHQDPWLGGELAFWLWRAGRLKTPPCWAARPFALHMSGAWAAAAAEWQRLGCPYQAASALAESDDEPTRRQALVEFERLGARPAAALVAQRLREPRR
jgi:transcriptional regulator with XRE-family HTH domain/tetratricopeptide (TPR) repeat protein